MQIFVAGVVFLINVTLVACFLPFRDWRLNMLYMIGGIAVCIEVLVLLGIITNPFESNSGDEFGDAKNGDSKLL